MKNLYFIATLPEGHLPQYHRALSENLSKKFNIPLNTNLLLPHITLKAPFEATPDDLATLKKKLLLFSEEQYNPKNKVPFWIKGFGHLGRRIINLDVIPSSEMVRAVSKMQETLCDLPWISWKNHEPIFHFHVTILRNNIEEKFDGIWDTLEKRSAPHFHLLFDNITLLQKNNDRWIIDTTYQI